MESLRAIAEVILAEGELNLRPLSQSFLCIYKSKRLNNPLLYILNTPNLMGEFHIVRGRNDIASEPS